MRIEVQRSKADRLRELHREGVLVLPNAWDALSARIFEDCGFAAIATTSAGIAYALGYPDGERLTRDEMAEATSRIASVVEVRGQRLSSPSGISVGTSSPDTSRLASPTASS
jgi:2-methylisocitrate lyase-like PEP mutase family enzyme